MVSAQSPSSSFPRGSSLQSWQNPSYKTCSRSARTRRSRSRFRVRAAASANAAPPDPVLPPTAPIPGVLAAGQSWKVVWSWEGNNVDGPIAGDNGTLLFANNDASNVMQLDPATGLANVALPRHEHRRRGLAQQERRAVRRRTRARRRHRAAGAAAEAAGEHVPRRAARMRRRRDERSRRPTPAAACTSRSPAPRGVFYANPKGVVSQYGKDVPLANGIILSPDEKTLYVTNGAVVFAFDVKPDGSLTNQREFGKLRGGEGGDGSAVDQQGRRLRGHGQVGGRLRGQTASSSARFRARRACTARSSAAGTRRRSSASSSTARGARRARETRSSRFRRSRRVIPGGRSSSGDSHSRRAGNQGLRVKPGT